MLASPLLVGTLASGPALIHLVLAMFWLAGYLAFFATSLWLKSGRRSRWWPPVRAYVPLAAVLGLVVLALQPGLVRWAPAFVLPLGVGLYAAASRHERDLLAGLTTVAGSSLMTMVAYDAGTTGALTVGWQLAAVQFAYFAGTVFYVKSAIRERRNRRFLWWSVAAHALATLAMALLAWWLVLVFAVLTLRAWWAPPRGFTPKQLGIGEIVSTIVVGVVSLLVIG